MNRLPPGPKRLGLLEVVQGGAVASVEHLLALAKAYGPTFRLPYRRCPMTFTGDPRAIQAVYSAEPEVFRVWGVSDTEPIFGTRSIVVSDGERHRRDRKLLAPHFRMGALSRFGGTFREVAEAVSAKWPLGQPFSFLSAAQEMTLELIVRVIFGMRSEVRARRAKSRVEALVRSIHPAFMIFPALRRRFGGLGPWARSQRAQHALNAVLLEEMETRRAVEGEEGDLLEAMLKARDDAGRAMQDEEILDQLRALLFAGHDTTAMALAWSLVWLDRTPAARIRLEAELDALGRDPPPEAFYENAYLGAVCLEVLRLTPPVVDVARIALRPFDLGDYRVPAGEAIRPALPILHAREDLYPEPTRFRPERFLERRYSPFEYIPFGGGARRCLGANMALCEMKVILGTVLRRYRLRLAPQAPITFVRRGLTMGPSGAVLVTAELRRDVRSTTTANGRGVA